MLSSAKRTTNGSNKTFGQKQDVATPEAPNPSSSAALVSNQQTGKGQGVLWNMGLTAVVLAEVISSAFEKLWGTVVLYSVVQDRRLQSGCTSDLGGFLENASSDRWRTNA